MFVKQAVLNSMHAKFKNACREKGYKAITIPQKTSKYRLVVAEFATSEMTHLEQLNAWKTKPNPALRKKFAVFGGKS